LLAAYAVAQAGMPAVWDLFLAVVAMALFVATSAMLDMTSRDLLLGLCGRTGPAPRESAASP
jgi:hypothetical protein